MYPHTDFHHKIGHNRHRKTRESFDCFGVFFIVGGNFGDDKTKIDEDEEKGENADEKVCGKLVADTLKGAGEEGGGGRAWCDEQE